MSASNCSHEAHTVLCTEVHGICLGMRSPYEVTLVIQLGLSVKALITCTIKVALCVCGCVCTYCKDREANKVTLLTGSIPLCGVADGLKVVLT